MKTQFLTFVSYYWYFCGN